MKKQAFLATLAIMAHSAVWAQAAPQLAYKDIYIGQDASFFRQNSQYTCSKEPKLAIGDESCIMRPGEKPTIANVPATAVLAVIYENRVHSIIVAFKPADFTQVSQALEEKFGKPTDSKTATVTTAAGGSFENTILKWVTSDGMINVQKYGSRLTSTSMEISSHESLKLFEERQKRRAKSSSTDL